METKKCNKCGRELPRDRFSVRNGSKDGLQSYCKDCLNAMNRKNYTNNRHSKVNDDNTKHMYKVYSNEELAGFTPRELMAELKARGFTWDYMLEPQRKIMFDKI